MIIPKESPSREVLERIAQDYRRRGYEVFVEPRGKDLPPFLSDVTPDLVARRGSEGLVIEVKSSPERVDPSQLNAIAKRVSEHPGWHFVLMATDPRGLETSNELLSPLEEDDIKRRLEETRSLLNAGHVEAALMLGWAATEAILRLIVAREELSVDRNDTRSLLRSLASEGFIGSEDFRNLNNAFLSRGSIAHGMRGLPVESANEAKLATESLLAISQTLLRELPKSA